MNIIVILVVVVVVVVVLSLLLFFNVFAKQCFSTTRDDIASKATIFLTFGKSY